jgi:hypothetical protein
MPFCVLSTILDISIASADDGDNVEAGGLEYHEHVVAFFVGVAQEGARDDGVAVGIEYERRWSSRFGIGASLEHTFGDIDTWVIAIPLAYHAGAWKLYAGPGLEDGEEGSEALLRVGAEHGFEVGEWEFAPQVDIDFVDGERTWVVGITFAKGM